MKHPDWSTITVENPPKNPNYPMPTVSDNAEFITLLYKNMLLMDEPETGEGHKGWMSQLANGRTRDYVYSVFVKVALEENAKNTRMDFAELVDKSRTNKRALMLIKESIGDCFIITSLFPEFHKQYPDHDLYIMTEPKYFEIFEGHPDIHKIVPYVQAGEHEMAMIGTGGNDPLFHIYFHPAIQTQRQLNYLSHFNTYEAGVCQN